MPRRWPPAATLLAVAAITAGAFAPALRNGFVDFDDQANFVDNLRFRGLGPTHLRWMATAFVIIFISCGLISMLLGWMSRRQLKKIDSTADAEDKPSVIDAI